MKKRVLLRVYAVLFFVFLILFFIVAFPKFFILNIFIPTLSPFLDYSPFNASITILSNFPPVISDLRNEYFFCENNRSDEYFNVSDIDAGPLAISLSPINPFFIFPTITQGGKIIEEINLFSAVLDKSKIDENLGYKLYQESVTVSDGIFTDRRDFNITVIEINNRPSVSNIGVQTIWTKGENSTFYHQIKVNDIENGNQNFGNFTYNLTFLNNAPKLFNISTNGSMIFTPNLSQMQMGLYNVSVYNISLCVNDSAITPTHSRIFEICNQNGGPISICQSFSLALTDENRPPIITSYYPNLSYNAFGNELLYFNITKKDPDGTIPDAYWYVDDIFLEYDNGSLFDEFNYTFGCGISGVHRIKVDITDGLLNDSRLWNIDVGLVSCPSGPSSSGGGGGGSIKSCAEKWACFDWNICQEADNSFRAGLLSSTELNKVKEDCSVNFYGDSCGIQSRNCVDFNFCNTTANMPNDFSVCYFVLNPSCSDGVKNCHDGSCEALVDCGGPCTACPTCTDGIENQGEKDVDCGGPCPLICPAKLSLFQRIKVQFTLGIGILLLLIIVIVQLVRLFLAKKKVAIEDKK